MPKTAGTKMLIGCSSYLLPPWGFLRTRMTESPRKNILLMYLSLLTGLAFFFPGRRWRKVVTTASSNGRHLLLLTLSRPRHLSPHFLDALQDHIAVAVEGLNSTDELFVVSAVDQDLSVVFDRLSQHGQGPRVELLFLAPFKLFSGHFWPWSSSNRRRHCVA